MRMERFQNVIVRISAQFEKYEVFKVFIDVGMPDGDYFFGCRCLPALRHRYCSIPKILTHRPLWLILFSVVFRDGHVKIRPWETMALGF